MLPATQSDNSLQIEPGSFRDRDGRVFYHNGRVFRALSADAATQWQHLAQSKLFERATREGQLVKTSIAESAPTVEGEWAAVLEHEPIPIVSYPYEWSFSMLKDAGLLQLDLLLEALEQEMTLIDCSAFNTQWIGARPVFIDIPSFRKVEPGQPWLGYRQFCQLFLYPLFLQAYKKIAFHSWLRGSIDGIDPEDCNRLMSFWDCFRAGVFKHVVLHAKLQSRHAATTRDVKDDLRSAGFNDELVRMNVRSMRKLVAKLSWQTKGSEWSDYTATRNYEDADLERKRQFVGEVAASRKWELAWDLGCNTGEFSRIASEHAQYVVASDIDHLAVERLYASLKKDGPKNILPLVSNLADPSPALGWRGQERQSLDQRVKPDLVLALALIHHAVLTANIPLQEFVEWLANLTRHTLIIEFVTRDDPMVKTLLRNKEDKFTDYDLSWFEQCLERHFKVETRAVLPNETRILYSLTRQ